jgi:hypothetical protein
MPEITPNSFSASGQSAAQLNASVVSLGAFELNPHWLALGINEQTQCDVFLVQMARQVSQAQINTVHNWKQSTHPLFLKTKEKRQSERLILRDLIMNLVSA